MRPDCNSHFGGARLIVLISIVAAVVISVLFVRYWAPQRVVERQQAALIVALERRSAKRLDRLLAPDYRDQWEFDREEAKLAIQDIGSQFFVLTLLPVEPETNVTGDTAEVSLRFNASGNGGPLAHEVIRKANQLKTPFIFIWKKQSAWPGDWKLTRIENADLARELHGYRPGDIKRAMELE